MAAGREQVVDDVPSVKYCSDLDDAIDDVRSLPPVSSDNSTVKIDF